jgi:hypothetical protein
VLLPMECRKVTALFFCSRTSALTQSQRKKSAISMRLVVRGRDDRRMAQRQVQKDFSGLLGAQLRVSWRCSSHLVSFGPLI